MKKTLNNVFVKKLRTRISKEVQLVPFLMDLLDMTKESVYRRVRSQIPFTFEEISRISIELGMSIDEIIGNNENQRVFFDIKSCAENKAIEILGETMQSSLDIIQHVRKGEHSKLIFAGNRFPVYTSIPFENLIKFRIFRWIHQVEDVPLNFYLSDFKVPQDIITLQKKFVYEYQRIKKQEMIVDNNTLHSSIKDINYFYKRELINTDELRVIQDELYQLVDHLEMLTKKGVNKVGSDVLIYVSTLNIEVNSLYYESDDQSYSQLWSYFSSQVNISNTEATRNHKYWLESLKKYATLITLSDEVQRSLYLNRQRRLIANIDQDMLP